MLYLILPNIRSCYNVGSIFRTADAFGVNKIFLCGYTPTPDKNPKIKKVSLGAEKNVPWEHHAHAWRVVEQLKRDGVRIIAAEQTKNAIDYRAWKPTLPLALILGNEVGGIARALLKRADDVIEIPMHGKKESLNVSVAMGILAAHIRMVA
ncbi:hypothetical protein A3H75_00480 [Candidatus Uhrbacteria bacterium RIFCSPLOWO2_02_FULL_51_9]|uniref:tRNA/rRNA methyltransferase SpoU type domain-containing protein n=1 Tax=Candidatus Uhrbacteria bacterium RIFCSPLOWO2_02_FULL_51_9 TaxID=1802410 RepID=A0A1F7VE35_9BACT|nr:MAG: hypothetical protein A3H75_00480 [Candidatus Uhrbacteria bacterium RIFCSPLOWO2_02_FULL_51_9]